MDQKMGYDIFIKRCENSGKVASFLLLLMLASCASTPSVDSNFATDPLTGDWQGTQLSNGRESPIFAQVWAVGQGQYRANLLSEFDSAAKPLAVLEGNYQNGKVTFSDNSKSQEGWLTLKMFIGFFSGANAGTFEMSRVVRLSPMLGAKPGPGAVMLFDGGEKSLSNWATAKDGTPVKWKLVDGAMEVVPGTDSIVTRQKFRDYMLHLEFRLPLMVSSSGQARGNSGVYHQGRYEVQVLDSYGLEGKDNECGGIYKVAAPRVNMCAPAGQWQSYDIIFHAPVFDSSGEKIQNARITVIHNGILIHDNQQIPQPTGGAGDKQEVECDSLMLQNHGDKVQYRNIWLIKLR
jgi:hypothetical protein